MSDVVNSLITFLESHVGQQLLIVMAIILGVCVVKAGMVEEGKLMVSTAGGALLMSLKTGASISTRVQTPTTTTTVQSESSK